jgi:hypothetical protein
VPHIIAKMSVRAAGICPLKQRRFPDSTSRSKTNSRSWFIPEVNTQPSHKCDALFLPREPQLHKPNRCWMLGRVMGVSPDTPRTLAGASEVQAVARPHPPQNRT